MQCHLEFHFLVTKVDLSLQKFCVLEIVEM